VSRSSVAALPSTGGRGAPGRRVLADEIPEAAQVMGARKVI
jgi:hypothetical protein